MGRNRKVSPRCVDCNVVIGPHDMWKNGMRGSFEYVCDECVDKSGQGGGA